MGDEIWKITNHGDQAAGGVEARSGVEFFGRHGQAEQKIPATLPPRTGGWVIVEGPAAPAAGYVPKHPAYRVF